MADRDGIASAADEIISMFKILLRYNSKPHAALLPKPPFFHEFNVMLMLLFCALLQKQHHAGKWITILLAALFYSLSLFLLLFSRFTTVLN